MLAGAASLTRVGGRIPEASPSHGWQVSPKWAVNWPHNMAAGFPQRPRWKWQSLLWSLRWSHTPWLNGWHQSSLIHYERGIYEGVNSRRQGLTGGRLEDWLSKTWWQGLPVSPSFCYKCAEGDVLLTAAGPCVFVVLSSQNFQLSFFNFLKLLLKYNWFTRLW